MTKSGLTVHKVAAPRQSVLPWRLLAVARWPGGGSEIKDCWEWCLQEGAGRVRILPPHFTINEHRILTKKKVPTTVQTNAMSHKKGEKGNTDLFDPGTLTGMPPWQRDLCEEMQPRRRKGGSKDEATSDMAGHHTLKISPEEQASVGIARLGQFVAVDIGGGCQKQESSEPQPVIKLAVDDSDDQIAKSMVAIETQGCHHCSKAIEEEGNKSAPKMNSTHHHDKKRKSKTKTKRHSRKHHHDEELNSQDVEINAMRKRLEALERREHASPNEVAALLARLNQFISTTVVAEPAVTAQADSSANQHHDFPSQVTAIQARPDQFISMTVVAEPVVTAQVNSSANQQEASPSQVAAVPVRPEQFTSVAVLSDAVATAQADSPTNQQHHDLPSQVNAVQAQPDHFILTAVPIWRMLLQERKAILVQRKLVLPVLTMWTRFFVLFLPVLMMWTRFFVRWTNIPDASLCRQWDSKGLPIWHLTMRIKSKLSMRAALS